MTTKIDFDKCHTKWGAHPKYTYYTRHIGQIIKVHNDGSCDVKTEPLLSFEEGKIIHNVNLFHIDPWDEKHRDTIINSLKKRVAVGNWVELMEQRNLFYIYIWEKKHYYHPNGVETKHVFRKGEPKIGPQKRYLIERIWSSKKRMECERFTHY